MTKYQLIERYRARHDLPLSAPRIAQLDLAYHDLRRDRGLYYQLQRNGAVHRVNRNLDIFEANRSRRRTTGPGCAASHPPRPGEAARLRRRLGALQLHDRAQRTVLCKDRFRSVMSG